MGGRRGNEPVQGSLTTGGFFTGLLPTSFTQSLRIRPLSLAVLAPAEDGVGGAAVAADVLVPAVLVGERTQEL